jgi:hypothetical protein
VQHVRNKKAVCDGFVGVANFFSATQFAQELKSLCQQLEDDALSNVRYDREMMDSNEKIRTFDPKTISDLQYYSGMGYLKMNECLRSQNSVVRDLCDPSLLQMIHRIESALKKKRLGEMTLYRYGDYRLIGLQEDDAKIDDLSKLVGRPIRDKGFMSTTVIPTRDKKYNVQLVIQGTAGTEGLVIEPISYFPWEKEVLLQRDTEYVITKAKQNPSGEIVAYVRIIPKGRNIQPKVLKRITIKDQGNKPRARAS